MSDITRRKQMIYRANHRGIKEMDIILGGYANRFIMEMTVLELDAFEKIMDELDRDLLTWFTGEIPFPDGFDQGMISSILDYTQKTARN